MQTLIWKGFVVQAGEFKGLVRYVESEHDLPGIDASVLVVLDSCPKHVAALAISQAGAAVNITSSLTAHLVLCLPKNLPFAVCTERPESIPNGEQVELQWEDTGNVHSGTLPWIGVLDVSDGDILGTKAARLAYLRSSGYSAPMQIVIPLTLASAWLREALGSMVWESTIKKLTELPVEMRSEAAMNASHDLSLAVDHDLLHNKVQDWLAQNQPPFPPPYAVRSSGATEDSADDPMAGCYTTVTSVSIENLVDAVIEVVLGAFNPELIVQSPCQPSPPAILIQPMVPRPLFAGTLFVRTPGKIGSMVLEGVWDDYAGALMDGTKDTDIQLFASYDLTELVVLKHPVDISIAEVETLARSVFQQALQIYLDTGWGDLEYVIDKEGRLWWVQARPLPHRHDFRVVERVERRDFHPWSIRYYQQIAFRVAEANRTPQVSFELVILEPGVFGYTEGIRQRDAEFHRRTQESDAFLREVTAFGWDVESRMQSLIAKISDVAPETLLDALTLHGGVQAPFSMPVDPRFHARHDSFPLDDYSPQAWFMQFLGSLPQTLLGDLSAFQVVRLLYVSLYMLSALEGLKFRLALAESNTPLKESDAEAILAFDTRDVLVPGTEKYSRLCIPIIQEIEQLRKQPAMLKNLQEAAVDFKSAHEARLVQRQDFLSKAKGVLDLTTWQRLSAIADYLQMKAETNETHSFYRGTVFLYLGKIQLPGLPSILAR